jgi:hypothetical protein
VRIRSNRSGPHVLKCQAINGSSSSPRPDMRSARSLGRIEIFSSADQYRFRKQSLETILGKAASFAPYPPPAVIAARNWDRRRRQFVLGTRSNASRADGVYGSDPRTETPRLESASETAVAIAPWHPVTPPSPIPLTLNCAKLEGVSMWLSRKSVGVSLAPGRT